MTTERHSPEWLIENADHGIAFEVACASALTRLLAANAELQQQLEAIGAGGVGPLMKPVISGHVDQHLDKVWLPRTLLNRSIQEIVRYCNTGEMDDAESLLASLQFSIDPAQQPPKDEPAPLEFRA